jgi:hypothetical protein
MNKLPSGKLSRRSQRHFELDRRTYASAPTTVSVPADPVTLSEERQRKLLETVAVKVQQNRIAMQQVSILTGRLGCLLTLPRKQTA